jgi:hypothetical protein
MSPAVAFSLIRRESGTRLCAEAVEGLASFMKALPQQITG